MTLLEKIKSKLTNEKVNMPEAAPMMDLEQALKIHRVLNEKLQKTLEGDEGMGLEIATVSQDHVCTIGKWLYGEGKQRYGHLPEYEAMRKMHAELHTCAGEVLTEYKIGNKDYAEVLFKTTFRNASNKNRMEFTRLFHAANR